MSQRRIPRKKGQPAKSKKHSDLYTDEDPKGTIKGLKFATVKDAEASVRKIKASSRSHNHKTQAAIAMEQRARVAGKIAAANVYRRFIEAQKKKTRASREVDIRKWSHDFLEVPNKMLNGLPPCPYAKQAWLQDQVKFSINTGLDGLAKEVADFDNHKYDIVIWASEYLLDMEYLDGWCDGVNEAMSIAGQDMHLMVFHPDYDAKEAGLEFLVEDDVTDDELVYCMVFVQKLSLLDDASLSLEKSGYFQYFPKDTYESLVVDRRRLRNGNGWQNKNG